MHRLLNACVAIMCVVKEVTVASKRALACHTPAFPPISPSFFPVFPRFPPFSPIFPIFPIFPWPKEDLETPGWETSKACTRRCTPRHSRGPHFCRRVIFLGAIFQRLGHGLWACARPTGGTPVPEVMRRRKHNEM